MENHYQVLGVSESASETQIREAYKRLAKKHHPDLHRGDPAQEEIFKRVSLAHTVLTNPTKRQRHDAKLAYSRGQRTISSGPTTTSTRSSGGPQTASGPERGGPGGPFGPFSNRPQNPFSRNRGGGEVPKFDPKVVRRAYLIVVGSILLLALAGVLFDGYAKRLAAQEEFEKAQKRFEQGDYSQTITSLEKSLESDPDKPEALEMLAEVRVLYGYDTQASQMAMERWYRRLDADNLPARYHMLNGILLWNGGDFVAARAAYERSLAQDPKDDSTHLLLAESYYFAPELKTLEEQYRAQQRPVDEAFKTKEAANYEKAISHYQRALRTDGHFAQQAEHWMRLGYAQIRLAQYPAAEASLDKALHIQGGSGEGLYYRGLARARQGKQSRACSDFTLAEVHGFPQASEARAVYCPTDSTATP